MPTGINLNIAGSPVYMKLSLNFRSEKSLFFFQQAKELTKNVDILQHNRGILVGRDWQRMYHIPAH